MTHPALTDARRADLDAEVDGVLARRGPEILAMLGKRAGPAFEGVSCEDCVAIVEAHGAVEIVPRAIAMFLAASSGLEGEHFAEPAPAGGVWCWLFFDSHCSSVAVQLGALLPPQVQALASGNVA